MLYLRLAFCLVEAGRVEDSTFMENTMQAHWRWAQLGAGHIKWKVRRRRTSASVKSLSITKFLFEAPIAFSVRTKLRTSPRFLHGLNDWNRFFEPLTSSMFPRTLMVSYIRFVETQNLGKPNTMMLASMVEVPPNLSKILRLQSFDITRMLTLETQNFVSLHGSDGWLVEVL